MSDFGEYAAALQARDVLTEMIVGIIDKERPKPRYGEVISIDTDNNMLSVQMPEGGDPVPVGMDSLAPVDVGQQVRLEGPSGDKYVGGIYGGVAVTEADTGVVPGSYGDSTHIPTFTVEHNGKLSAAGEVAIVIPDTLDLSPSGSITTPPTTPDTGTVLSMVIGYTLDPGSYGIYGPTWQSGGWSGPRGIVNIEGTLEVNTPIGYFGLGTSFQNTLRYEATVDGDAFGTTHGFRNSPLFQANAVDVTFKRDIDGLKQVVGYSDSPIFRNDGTGSVDADMAADRDMVVSFKSEAFVGDGASVNRRAGLFVDDASINSSYGSTGTLDNQYGVWVRTLTNATERNIPFLYGYDDGTVAFRSRFRVGDLGHVIATGDVSAVAAFTGIGAGTSGKLMLRRMPLPDTRAGDADSEVAMNTGDLSDGTDVTTFAGAGLLYFDGDDSDYPAAGVVWVQTTDSGAIVSYTGKAADHFTGCNVFQGTGLLYGSDYASPGGIIRLLGANLANGAEVGKVGFQGWSGKQWRDTASIRVVSTEDTSDSAAGGRVFIGTSANGTVVPVDHLEVGPNGNVRLVPFNRTFTSAIDPLLGISPGRVLTANYTANKFPTFISHQGTCVVSQAPTTDLFVGVSMEAIIKSTFHFATTALDNSITVYNDITTVQVDTTTARTLGIYTSHRVAPSIEVISTGTITSGVLLGYDYQPSVAAGISGLIAQAVRIRDIAGAGSVATQEGIVIDPMTKAAAGPLTRIGIINNEATIVPGAIYGDITAGGDLILNSTAHATKGTVFINDTVEFSGNIRILNGAFASVVVSAVTGSDKILTLPNVASTVAVIGIDNAFTVKQTVTVSGTNSPSLIAVNATNGASVAGTDYGPIIAGRLSVAPTTFDSIGTVNFQAISTGTTYQTGAQIRTVATQSWTGSTYGAALAFFTSPNGAGNLTQALLLNQDQSALFGGDVSILDHNIILSATTGTKFGTAVGQKLCFYGGVSPVAQPGATTDLGTVLSNLGLRASGTAYPITTSGDVTLSGTTLQTDGTTALFGLRRTSTPGLLGILGKLTFSAYDTGTNPVTGAIVQAVSVEPSGWSSGVAGTSLVIQTTAVGGATAANCATFGADKSFSPVGDVNIAAGKNIVLTTTGTKFGTGPTQKLSFYGAGVVAQPSAYTQTYSTADKTHANPTAATLTDNTTGSADTTLQALTSGSVYATDVAAIRNNFADLAAMVNKNTADMLDVKQLVNSIIDDLQALGLVG